MFARLSFKVRISGAQLTKSEGIISVPFYLMSELRRILDANEK
jgi:hypothetical protein